MAPYPLLDQDNLCIMCEEKEETFEHFLNCSQYNENNVSNWKDIFESDPDKQIKVAEEVKKRLKTRTRTQEAGQDSTTRLPNSNCNVIVEC